MDISRRNFIASTTLGGLTASALSAAETDPKTGMPMRLLGRTGARVSILAFGSGNRFISYGARDKAIAALNRALDLGINYIDTATSYGKGQSEEWIGEVLKTRRKGVWLATKLDQRKGDDANREVEASFKRLQLDGVDLIHIHSLNDAADLAAIEAKDGVLNALYKLRDQKVARAIGITCHADPAVLATALERHDFDCTQMALNAARTGMRRGKGGLEMDPNPREGFERLALAAALRKKMGVVAMKIFGQDGLSGDAPAEKLIRYSLSLPVASAVIGMPKLELIEQNIAIVKGFQPLPPAEMRELSGQLSRKHKARLDRFFRDHVDC